MQNNEAELDMPLHYVSKNIKFLRNAIGLSINDLASLVEMDPIDLFQYEKEEPERNVKLIEDLVRICNYATVPFEDIILTDLEAAKRPEPSVFEHLKDEFNGIHFNRKEFNARMFGITIPSSLKDTWIR